MPFINMKTTATLDIAKKDALSKELCIITRDCLGKGENWVMTGFEGECFSLLFRKHQRYCLCRSEMLRLSDQATDESYDKKSLHALRRRTWYSEETNLCCLLSD